MGDPRHVAELTSVPRPADGVEEVPVMLSGLLEAHEGILIQAHEMAARAAELGDDGTDGQLVFQVILTGGLQGCSWPNNVVDTPPARV